MSRWGDAEKKRTVLTDQSDIYCPTGLVSRPAANRPAGVERAGCTFAVDRAGGRSCVPGAARPGMNNTLPQQTGVVGRYLAVLTFASDDNLTPEKKRGPARNPLASMAQNNMTHTHVFAFRRRRSHVAACHRGSLPSEPRSVLSAGLHVVERPLSRAGPTTLNAVFSIIDSCGDQLP